MRERTHHREAFEAYVRLGADRSLQRLREALRVRGRRVSVRSFERWSAAFGWQQRLDELERKAREAEDEARIAAIREMQERQAKEALLLLQKGAEWIAPLVGEDVSPETAIRAITEGARLERLARGEPTERVSHEREPDPLLAGHDDAALQRLIEVAERGPARNPPGPMATEEEDSP